MSQINYDETFIKKLLDKLKVGNSRSIHLNVIPGRSVTRLDLHSLSAIDRDRDESLFEIEAKAYKNTSEKFIHELLNNSTFSFEISYDRLDLGVLTGEGQDRLLHRLKHISERLNRIIIENNDNYLEFGVKNFGIGFPILIKRDKSDPSKIIKAPLFIWNLDIEKSYQNKNTWTIKRVEDSPVKLNELLISHLAKDESIRLAEIPINFLDDGILNELELIEMCNNVLSQLGAKKLSSTIKLEKCPDVSQIKEADNSEPWIQWSGVFGIYLSQKETIIQSTEELLGKIDDFKTDPFTLEKYQISTISAIETDPSKDEIINTLTKNEVKLIQGPPGTGKSQAITAIISNALANNVKCLIVCEKKTALDVIQSNLEKAGLDNFSVIIDDVNKDRKKVVEKARDIVEIQEASFFSQVEFAYKHDNYTKIKREINKKYAEPLNKIFGDLSWKYLIGKYLRYSKSDDFTYLKYNLKPDSFEFTHEEYIQYIETISQSAI